MRGTSGSIALLNSCMLTKNSDRWACISLVGTGTRCSCIFPPPMKSGVLFVWQMLWITSFSSFAKWCRSDMTIARIGSGVRSLGGFRLSSKIIRRTETKLATWRISCSSMESRQ